MAAKRESLDKHGARNRHAERVRDPLFAQLGFFDREDLVQVKYEMLRRTQVDGYSVSAAAGGFGLSRPAFYAAQERFESEGLAGLVPRRSGPKGGHKLSAEVLDFLGSVLAAGGAQTPTPVMLLVERVFERFGIRVHRRSVERALGRWRKKNAARQG